MHNLIKTSAIINSNLVYGEIINRFNHLYNPQDALLLVPTRDNCGDLEVVEVIGELPTSLRYSQEEAKLDIFSVLPINKNVASGALSNYHDFIRITNTTGEYLAFLLFTLTDSASLDQVSINEFIQQTTSLLEIKHAVDSLPDLIKTQSKLKYQLSFFSNTINNIFEPYGIDMLIQLYMEIISEMFLLPSAVTLVYDGEKYCPLYAKGIKVNDCSEFGLDAQPFLKNRQLSTYPFLVAELTPDVLGEQNYAKLIANHAYLIAPVTWENTNYLIICMSSNDYQFDASDKVSLMALNNTVNQAVQFNSTKNSLMQNNYALDKKVFLLTSIYHASQFIFSETELDKTVEVSLDMLMEIFQSETSAVVLKNPYEDTFKLKRVKSVNHLESIEYTFAAPDQTDLTYYPLVDFTNDGERKSFMQLFPEINQLEDKLQPRIIAHLKRDNHYYGFITLSNRVTGQTYADEDKELLVLLLASIGIAIENCLMLSEIQEKNLMLNKSLQNIYAIQEVLNTIRNADNIEQFGQLLLEVLGLGLGVKTGIVIARGNPSYTAIYSNSALDPALIFPNLNHISREGVYDLLIDDNPLPVLVIPIAKQTHIQGYLIIQEFADSVIDDTDKTQLLTIISLIIGETFHNLLEKQAISKAGIVNYPLLISHRILQEAEQLSGLGLEPNIVRFYHPDPQKVLVACREWSEGFLFLPNAGIIISPLDKLAIETQLNTHTEEYQFLSVNNIEDILDQLFT